MRTRTALLFTASVAFIAWPLVAAAQQGDGFTLEEAPEKEPIVIHTSEIEVGVGGVSDDSFKFGEYSGLEDDGVFAIGNIGIHQRSPYDGESTLYWDLDATNLGLDSRSVFLEYGHQGSFRVFGNFDQIPHNRFDDGSTPYLGVGGTMLTLPRGGGGWDDGAFNDDAPDIVPLNTGLFSEFDVRTERKRYGGGAAVNMGKYWVLSGSYQHEEKDGVETLAGIFGSSGGNMHAAVLPKPIDFTTQEANVNLQYNGQKLQAQLAYHLSMFENNSSSLIWENAYPGQTGWDPSQDFDSVGQGQMALEPDNSAHQVALSGGYTFNPTTRATANFSYGRMLQDEDFLPFTINPSLSVPIGLPREDLAGDITTMHGNLNLMTRPTPGTRFRAKYTYDDRDNDTPADVYFRVLNDTADQDTDPAGDDARINRPYSRSSHKVELDGTFRVTSDTKLTFGYDFETIGRDLQEVEDTREHTGRIKLRTSPSPYASGWIEYDYSRRGGSEYISNQAWLVSRTPEHIAATPADEQFENNAFLRKYYLADRERHLVKGAITAMPSDQVTVGLSGSYSYSDYHNTVIGLTDMEMISATIDTSYMPTESINLSAFFTYDLLRHDQTGFERRGGDLITPDDLAGLFDKSVCGDPNRCGFWSVDTRDHGYTAGAEVEWKAIEDTLSLFFNYTFSYTNTEFGITADPVLGAGPLPDLNTTLHSVGVRGDYYVTKDVILRAAYRYENYDVDDFALDGVGNAVPRVITLGNDSPNYGIHVAGVTVVHAF